MDAQSSVLVQVVAPTVDSKPAAQGAQAVDESESESAVPAAQSAHSVANSAANLPATQLMDTRGVRVVEVQQTIAELRKTQAAVSRSLGETRDAVLWLQKLEVLEQQLVLVPEYRERAKKIVTDMQSIAIRVAKAKKIASALGGETFPEWDGSTQECEGN